MVTETTQEQTRLNLHDQVSDLRLLPGEKVVSVDIPPIKQSTDYPSALRALTVLTGVTRVAAIGEKGPSIAARALNVNENVEALRNFEVLFGRDSLRVALDVAPQFPKLLRSTVVRLAELQGVTDNLYREEEPGRIAHEVRDPASDFIAQRISKEQHWQWPYYGTVDATPMFVSAVVRASRADSRFLLSTYVGRDGQPHPIADALGASLDWIKRRMDSNQEGLLEFQPKFPGSHPNQSWKDSWDAYHHKDGTIANHERGIASIEVQALTYDALLDAAELYESLLSSGDPHLSQLVNPKEIADLRQRAQLLRETVMKNFWIEDKDGGCFALGTDRNKEGKLVPLAVRTSNMGHLLNSHLLDGDDQQTSSRREAIIRTLFSEEMLNASGIRTLGKSEVRFRPGAYHNGNVWLWDTTYIAQGLERHGYYGLSWDLYRRIWSVVDRYKKFPEFARGGNEPEPQLNGRIVKVWDEANNHKNTIEQVPQEIQAWSVVALLMAKYKYGARQLGRKGAIPDVATDPLKRSLETSLLTPSA